MKAGKRAGQQARRFPFCTGEMAKPPLVWAFHRSLARGFGVLWERTPFARHGGGRNPGWGTLMVVLLALALAGVRVFPSRAETDPAPPAGEAPIQEPYQGAALCPPRAGGPTGGYCRRVGPRAALDRLRRDGWSPDVHLFPGIPLSDAWFRLPREKLYYAKVQADRARMFRNPYNPEESSRRTLPPGFVYVSYTGVKTIRGKPWVHVGDGLWMRFQDLYRVRPSRFRGFYFVEPPVRPFGWVLYEGVNPRLGPGWDFPRLEAGLHRYQMVEVFDRVEKGEQVWYRIGPEMWIPQHVVGLVFPRTEPPEGVPASRWIEVNVFEQTLSVYEQSRLIYATLISSGIGEFYTRVGVFRIAEKLELETMRGAFLADRSDFYYLEDVPWTMYYDGARALHGAYWHDNFGFPQSHGCVNLAITDAYWLYQWAREGDWVYVWDPSGRTPAE